LVRDGANSTVFGHKDLWNYFEASYPTACPGGMNVDHVTQIANQGEEDMTPEQSQKLDAIYDALFKTSQVEAKTTGGNAIPGGVLRTLSALYDAVFVTKPTSLGSPGGVLASLGKIADKLGITK
jgi:hypothetical protein